MNYTTLNPALQTPLVDTKKRVTPGYAFEKPIEGLEVVRLPRIVYQDSGTSTEVKAPGNTYFRFRLPSDGCWDYSKAQLQADVRVTKVGGTYLRFSNGIWNIFDRMQHLNGGNCVEDRQFTNDCYDFKYLMEQDPLVVQQMGNDLFGIGTTADRDAWAATTKTYSFPLDLGFLTSGVLPFGHIGMRNGEEVRGLELYHDLQIYLADNSTYLETDGTSPVVYLSNIQIFVDKIEGHAWEYKLCEHVRSGRCSIGWKAIDKYQNPVFQVSQMLKISHRARYIDWINTVFVNLDNQQDMTQPTNRRWNYPKLTLEQYQFKDVPLGGQNSVYPSEAVDTKGEARRLYWMYLCWTQAQDAAGFPKYAPNLTLVNFNGPDANHGMFTLIGDFRSNRDEEKVLDNSVVNLFSSERQNNDIKLDLRFTSAPSIAWAANHFIQFSVVSLISKSGGISIPMSVIKGVDK